jgi:hypothetical protein
MPQNPSRNTGKVDRILETAERFARQTGGTFVEASGKRADFEVRERNLAANSRR